MNDSGAAEQDLLFKPQSYYADLRKQKRNGVFAVTILFMQLIFETKNADGKNIPSVLIVMSYSSVSS